MEPIKKTMALGAVGTLEISARVNTDTKYDMAPENRRYDVVLTLTEEKNQFRIDGLTTQQCPLLQDAFTEAFQNKADLIRSIGEALKTFGDSEKIQTTAEKIQQSAEQIEEEAPRSGPRRF